MKPDFLISYKFYSESDGGRKQLPSQGYRSDWTYKDDDGLHLYRIWPRFLDCDGNEHCSYQVIDSTGLANMYIVSGELAESVHQGRVEVGVQGYLMEGSRRVAEAEIIELLNINDR